jgi:HD-GYP domain-containing protein (c-di-GMP phosphodiesterase class II)
MIAVRPRLYLSNEVTIADDILAMLPPHDCRRFRQAQELDLEPGDAVIVATAAQAEILTRRGEVNGIVVVWSGQSGTHQSPVLLTHPAVAAVLDRSSSRDAIFTALKSAFALVGNLRGGKAARMLEQVLEIGRALASEKDLDQLLRLILTYARNLTHADGASIYTRDSIGSLSFRFWQNASLGDATGVQDIPVSKDSVAGHVSRTGEPLVLDDAYAIADDAPYRFSADSDRKLGYRTTSLLTVPLKNKADEVVGVLQLINRKDTPDAVLKTPDDFSNHVRSFDQQDQAVAMALAGQAGVALENGMLYADIERLFEGFIKASVQAIETRDPTTAGHSFRVANFTEQLAVAVDRSDGHGLRDVRFTREQLRELRYAALLHDFGKVGVREYVLVKAKKLYPHELELLKQRFRFARVSLERHAYQRLLALYDQRLDPAELSRRRHDIEQLLAADRARIDQYLQLVLKANEPTVSHETTPAELQQLLGFRFPGEEGEELPLLQEFEFANLALAKGSLNSQERTEIESHVSHTFAFLSLIPWTRQLRDLPTIAYSHHEKLDGTGYPRKLAGEDIPVQSRMMTIADIYDALTAPDRPYKQGLPPDRALSILEMEAGHGKIDGRLFKVFVESRAWQLTNDGS